MGTKLTRVAIGPTEVAGTAGALRDGLVAVRAAAEVALWAEPPSGYPSGRVLRRLGRIPYGLAAPLRHDVLHYEYGSTWVRFADAYWARALGRTVVARYHGDDCRLYSVAAERFPARARVMDPGDEERVRIRIRRLARVAHGAIVADRELATYLRPFFERVYLVPLPLRPRVDHRAGEAGGGRMVVLHACTDPRIKGTEAIEAAVRRAARAAPLELRLLIRRPHREVLAALAEADVVVDQLNSVTSGVFALEAMQRSLPVLGELDRRALAPYQRDLPVVAVDAKTLESQLVALARDPDRRRALGAAGRDYVARTHDLERVAGATLAVYAHARRARSGLYESTGDGVTPIEYEPE